MEKHLPTPLRLAAHVMPRVTCDLPLHQAIGVRQLPHISGLKLADPRFDKPGRIYILIGGKRLRKMILPQCLTVENSDIVAFNTVFGWAIMGAYPVEISPSSSTTASVSHAVSSQARTTYSAPQVLGDRGSLSCTMPLPRGKEHFESTHTLLPEGRFQVQLPWKADAPSLGESCLQAVRRFHASISRRGIWQVFQDVVKEYLDLEHTEPVPTKDLTLPHSQTYYMPMHAVIKDSSTTTKLRVVFDASAGTT